MIKAEIKRNGTSFYNDLGVFASVQNAKMWATLDANHGDRFRITVNGVTVYYTYIRKS